MSGVEKEKYSEGCCAQQGLDNSAAVSGERSGEESLIEPDDIGV